MHNTQHCPGVGVFVKVMIYLELQCSVTMQLMDGEHTRRVIMQKAKKHNITYRHA